MKGRVALLAPGVGLCVLVLVGSAVHSAPQGVVLGLGIFFVAACGAGLLISDAEADPGHDQDPRRRQ